jgi:hypothetical protein
MTADPVKDWALYWYEKLQIEAWLRPITPRAPRPGFHRPHGRTRRAPLYRIHDKSCPPTIIYGVASGVALVRGLAGPSSDVGTFSIANR